MKALFMFENCNLSNAELHTDISKCTCFGVANVKIRRCI